MPSTVIRAFSYSARTRADNDDEALT